MPTQPMSASPPPGGLRDWVLLQRWPRPCCPPCCTCRPMSPWSLWPCACLLSANPCPQFFQHKPCVMPADAFVLLLHQHLQVHLCCRALLVAVLAVRALGQTDLNPVSGVGKLSQVCSALHRGSPGCIPTAARGRPDLGVAWSLNFLSRASACTGIMTAACWPAGGICSGVTWARCA